MDWQTLVTRRASQKPPAEGGWNMFFTNWVIPEVWTPIGNPMLNGRGKTGAWFGWPDDPETRKDARRIRQGQDRGERKAIAVRSISMPSRSPTTCRWANI